MCYLFQASAQARGAGAPHPIAADHSLHSQHRQPNLTTDSWSFFNIGSSRNKRKLASGRETISDFSCRDRPPGYYADINLGCEVSLNFPAIYNTVLERHHPHFWTRFSEAHWSTLEHTRRALGFLEYVLWSTLKITL